MSRLIRSPRPAAPPPPPANGAQAKPAAPNPAGLILRPRRTVLPDPRPEPFPIPSRATAAPAARGLYTEARSMADIITVFIVIIPIIAYLWAARGFFSVPAPGLLPDRRGRRLRTPGSLHPTSSWGLLDPKETRSSTRHGPLGLLVPFRLTIAVLRPIVDPIIRANLDFDTVTNMVGGGLCGVVTGFITCGVLVLALGYLPTKSSIVGLPYQPMEFEATPRSSASPTS